MRFLIAAAAIAASTGFALAQAAEYYVVQHVDTQRCAIETEFPVTASTRVLINNKFTERRDAEAAMKTIQACNL